MPHCNCLQQLTHAIYLLKSKNLHRVSKPLEHIATTIVSRAPNVVRVRLSYDISPEKILTADTKVVDRADFGHLSEIDQMNYIAGQWRVYYVSYNA